MSLVIFSLYIGKQTDVKGEDLKRYTKEEKAEILSSLKLSLV